MFFGLLGILVLLVYFSWIYWTMMPGDQPKEIPEPILLWGIPADPVTLTAFAVVGLLWLISGLLDR